VLPIGILDFDPMPEGVGTYPWLLTAFRPWARFLDQKLKAAEPGCRPFHSLSSAFDDLYRGALLGWNRLDGAASREERVADAREADAGWAHLREGWTDFINQLFGAAVESGIVAKDGLFMLGIDDLDLNERNVRDLLGALRLLSHRRLVVIMTGHRRRLEQVLAQELYREASLGLPVQSIHMTRVYQQAQKSPTREGFRVAWGTTPEPLQVELEVEQAHAPQDDLDPPELKRRARLLADAMLNKAVPQALAVPKLSLHDALCLAVAIAQSKPLSQVGRVELSAWLAEALNSGRTTRSGLYRDAERLVLWLQADTRGQKPCLTVRAVVSASPGGAPAWQALADILENATNEDAERILSALPKGEQVEITVAANDWSPLGPVHQARSFEVRFAREGSLLPAVAELDVRVNWPNSHRWKSIQASPVVSTFVHLLDTEVHIGWPMPEGRLDLRSAELMARALERLGFGLPDDMLRVWLGWWTFPDNLREWPKNLPSLPSLLERLREQARYELRLRTWALRGLPLLTAPEHGLSDASIDALYAFTRALCADIEQDWSRLADEWDDLRERQYRQALGVRATDGLKNALDRLDRGTPWAARRALGGRAQWYNVPTPAGRDVLTELRRYHVPPTNLNANDFFSIAENRSGREHRHPLWSATAVTDFLAKVKRSEADSFRGLVDVVAREGSNRSLLPYLVSAWKALCQLAGLPDEGDRVRLTEDQDSLEFVGPRVELCPVVGEQLDEGYGYELRPIAGWRARQGNAELSHWPPALVGWLGQIQTALWRTSHPADGALRANLVVIHPQILATREVDPGLPSHYDWVDIDRLRLMWDTILTQMPMDPVGLKARKRFLLANWLNAVVSVRGDNLLRDTPPYPIPVAFGVLSGTMSGAFGNTPDRIPMRAWLRDLKIKALADADVVTDWNRQLTQLLSAAKIAPDDGVKRLRSWAQTQPVELEKVVQDRDAARRLVEVMTKHPGRAPSNLKALEDIVGVEVIAHIQTWMELGGG
jgi:hypothetical protein